MLDYLRAFTSEVAFVNWAVRWRFVVITLHLAYPLLRCCFHMVEFEMILKKLSILEGIATHRAVCEVSLAWTRSFVFAVH